MPVTVTIGGVPPTTEQQEAMRAALGIPEPFDLTATKLTLVGADKVIGLDSEDGDTPKLFTLNGIATFTGVAPDTVEGTMAAAETGADTFAAAGGGSLEWLAAGTPYNQPVGALTHDVAVPAGTQVGDMLILAMFPWGTISSIQTNTAQSLTALGVYSTAGEVGRIYGVVVTGSVPTTITITLSSANDMQAQAFTARGATQVAGTVLDGNAVGARTALTYNTDAADALVITLYTTTGSNDRVVSTYTPTGGAGGTPHAKWSFSTYGVVTGVHDGATGLNDGAVTWSAADTSGGRWLSVALKA